MIVSLTHVPLGRPPVEAFGCVETLGAFVNAGTDRGPALVVRARRVTEGGSEGGSCKAGACTKAEPAACWGLNEGSCGTFATCWVAVAGWPAVAGTAAGTAGAAGTDVLRPAVAD